MIKSRGEPRGFAIRTLKNLDFVTAAFPAKEVHVVAQTGNSLLGLIVFPVVKNAHVPHEHLRVSDLVQQGWPAWNQISGTQCETLGELLRNLRNAVAHGYWSFSSDSRECSKVRIAVELKDSWKVDMNCLDLQRFCRKFVELLEP